MFRTQSISFRINAVFVVVVSVLLLAFGAFNYHMTRNTLEAELDRRVGLVTERLRYSLPAAVWNFDEALIRKILRAEMASEALQGITLVTETEGAFGVARQRSGEIVEAPKPDVAIDDVREATLYFEERTKKTECHGACSLPDVSHTDVGPGPAL